MFACTRVCILCIYQIYCVGNDSENSSNAITNDSNFSNGITASSSETTQSTRQYNVVTQSPIIKHKEALKPDAAEVEVSVCVCSFQKFYYVSMKLY